MPNASDLEIIGHIAGHYSSEIHDPRGPLFDKAYIDAMATAHEYAGFDRALIGYHSTLSDGFLIAARSAERTTKLKFLLAHRPGFVSPTVAARKLATLDQYTDGRLALHIISGGSDAEQQRDGDFANKEERYQRSEDFLDVIKKTWTSTTPFDHDGPFYTIRDSLALVKPVQQPHPPIFVGGASEAAIQLAGRHADTYALFGEPIEETRAIVSRVRAAAAAHGRAGKVSFSVSLRPILAHSEAAAWERAERILEEARARLQRNAPSEHRGGPSQSTSRERQLAAAQVPVRDKRLWTGIAALSNAIGNSMGVVGTPAQVAETLLDYYDVGVTKFLIRGFDPLEDTVDYGRELIPLLREAVASRPKQIQAAS